jgi:hypothetical protein
MGIDLPLIWAVIILFAVMMYVVMDGFDLGIGLLFPFVPERRGRDVMMNTVAPVWDGNETWLVLGGAGLFVAFPVAYAAILSAFYLPLVLMLVGLIFRGVAFEFRFKASDRSRPLWDAAFAGGSLVATFFQGVTLGAFLEGIPLAPDGEFAGGALDWLAPFPLFVGAGLCVAYALLGGSWLVMKTEGELQQRMRTLCERLGHRGAAARLARPALAGAALPDDAGAGVPRLHGAGHQPVAARDPAGNGHLGGRRPAAEPRLHAGGRAADHADDPGLHGLGLLGVPRQGHRHGGLPLMRPQRELGRRLLWLLLLYAAGLGVLGAAAWLLRWLMWAAGLAG